MKNLIISILSKILPHWIYDTGEVIGMELNLEEKKLDRMIEEALVYNSYQLIRNHKRS